MAEQILVSIAEKERKKEREEEEDDDDDDVDDDAQQQQPGSKRGQGAFVVPVVDEVGFLTPQTTLSCR